MDKMLYLPASDNSAYSKLERIESAINAAEVRIKEIEREFSVAVETENDNERGVLRAKANKDLSGLSADVDYIFSELDQVRGGDMVKAFRKLLTERLGALGRGIDDLIEREGLVKR